MFVGEAVGKELPGRLREVAGEMEIEFEKRGLPEAKREKNSKKEEWSVGRGQKVTVGFSHGIALVTGERAVSVVLEPKPTEVGCGVREG